MEEMKKLEERVKVIENTVGKIAKSLKVIVERQNMYGTRVLELDKEIGIVMEVINEAIEGANEREKKEPDLRMFG